MLKYSKKIIITLLLNVKTISTYNNRINIKQQTIDMWILNKLKSNDGFIESLKQCLTFSNVILVRWYWCPATKQYIGRAIIYLKPRVINRLKQAKTVILIGTNKTLGYSLVYKEIKINRVKLYLN